jgi:hypothetical protein
MSNQYAQLVERINRIVRDRGDVELMVLLDRIADRETEAEQAAALGAVVKILNQNKKPTGSSASHGAPASQVERQTSPADAAIASTSSIGAESKDQEDSSS